MAKKVFPKVQQKKLVEWEDKNKKLSLWKSGRDGERR